MNRTTYKQSEIATLIDQLPLEVQLKIFGCLKTVQDVANVRAVSKQWRYAIDQHTVLWRFLHLPLPKRHPNEAEKWYRKAATLGNKQAILVLSLLYTYGYRCSCHNDFNKCQRSGMPFPLGVAF